MRVGVTDCLNDDKYGLYAKWIHAIDTTVDIVKLSYLENNAEKVTELDGLLITGGGDVHPRFYTKEDHLDLTEDVDERRDEFEFDVLEKALDSEVPIFGICRGMQVMNVCLGGSLIRDLKSEGFDDHSGSKQHPIAHAVTIHPHSLLKEVAGSTEPVVNSHHHQAVKDLGRGLVASAVSTDGVVEAAEWVMKDGMPFLLLVQWHPERDKDQTNVFSKNLASLFLREAQHSKRTKATKGSVHNG